ncbi:MAG: PilZ domain-containing protein [Hyphomonadaceae bacterium]|nr:PilZ domain-containing protein [Hyphomonadaceae bacterium]
MAADLARAHALLSLARRDAPDRRRFRRLDVGLSGRLLDRAGEEHDCRTLDISVGDARLASPARGRVGDTMIVYLKDVGRVEAEIVRLLDGSSFAVQFHATAHKRERIAEQLTVLINPACGIEDERRVRRFSGSGVAPVELEDGTVVPCEILDFSLVGIAVKCARRPLIGAWVKVGNQYGRVGRYIDQGFAIDFEARPTPPKT